MPFTANFYKTLEVSRKIKLEIDEVTSVAVSLSHKILDHVRLYYI